MYNKKIILIDRFIRLNNSLPASWYGNVNVKLIQSN